MAENESGTDKLSSRKRNGVTPVEWDIARQVVDHPHALGVYAAPEWADLGDDGKAWAKAIIEVAIAKPEDPTPPVVPADAAERVEAKAAYWIVFDPTGQPAEMSLKPSYDESMWACFGAQSYNLRDWWQHNLDAGWTCREVSIVPRAEAAEQATTTRQQDAAGTMAEMERLVEDLAEVIHDARWAPEDAHRRTPFSVEDRRGREYCTRLASAVYTRLRSEREVPADLVALSDAATKGPWHVTTEDVDGNYGGGPDCGSGWKGYAIRTGAEQYYGKDAVVLDTTNNEVSEIHEASGEYGIYAWDEPARANAEYVADLVNWHRAQIAAQQEPKS